VHDELVELIWAEPANDAPREVYADWLAERGDARGEFIALQLREARGSATSVESRRAKRLLATHRTAWLGTELAAALIRPRFARGFMISAKVRDGVDVTDPAARASRELWFVERLDGHPAAIQLAPGMRSLQSVRVQTETELVMAIERREPQLWQHVATGSELTYEHVLAKVVASPAFRRVAHLEVWVWPDSLKRLVMLSKRLGWPNANELAKLTLSLGAGFTQRELRAKLHALGVASLAREVTSRDMYGNTILL
jgi:uncharacterized protein (TIGR02996 family)